MPNESLRCICTCWVQMKTLVFSDTVQFKTLNKKLFFDLFSLKSKKHQEIICKPILDRN